MNHHRHSCKRDMAEFLHRGRRARPLAADMAASGGGGALFWGDKGCASAAGRATMPKIEPHRYDVIIVGSSLGGLASGAMLANKGYSIAVVDRLPTPGGRMGTTQQNGYSICWGQRDGLGSTDLAFIPQYVYEAAEQAGGGPHFAPPSR